MQIKAETLKMILQSIVMLEDEEMGCDSCYQEVDRFIEMHLEGKDPAEAMPIVQHHLEICRDCKEEYEALMAALKAIQTPDTDES